ncbi:SMI1/KNR4 family protein [Candidatus Odyssella thessalonicensis]|uniref:SMI1/KNR4 family protein n=1 Tax=Candidatus Odyssella thessalonicensis TaxID=84647 RepID=UPI000225A8D3|nr:SMI1/KNR4 family protein [Candidatus Odyssella thessalonicensis]
MEDKFSVKLAAHMNELEGLYGGPCSKQEITAAQEQLKLKFHKEFVDFLLKYGGGIVGSYYIYGLKRIPLMGNELWSVTQNTDFYKDKQQWPGIEEWYVISEDGLGNPIGIDPEGKVWVSDHDADFEKTKLADNFEEFLDKILSNTLYQ